MSTPRDAPGYVDLHAHVLAAVDDGPASLDESMRLLERMASVGVTTVAATSHVSPDYPNRPEDLAAAHDQVVSEAAAHNLPVSVLRGAEVDMTMAMTLPSQELSALCLQGTRWLLLETPHSRYPAGLPELIGDLRSRGLEILIAHPERNPHIQKNPGVLAAAVSAGAVAQITGASLRGVLGRSTLASARTLVEDGLAHVVASDAHSVRHRTPDSNEAAQEARSAFGPLVAEVLLRHAPLAITQDASADEVKSLSASLRPRRKRGWLRR